MQLHGCCTLSLLPHESTRADAPSWGRALASAGMKTFVSNHLGYAMYNMQSRRKLIHVSAGVQQDAGPGLGVGPLV